MSWNEEIKLAIDRFQLKTLSQLEALAPVAAAIIDGSRQLEKSWSGSFAGWHGAMYFLDFRVPALHQRFSGEWGDINGIPEGWNEKQPEQVLAKLDGLVGAPGSVKRIEDELGPVRKMLEAFKTDVEVILAELRSETLGRKESQLLEQIEQFAFGPKRGQYVKMQMPKQLISRDSEALYQGMYVPAWLSYQAVGSELIGLKNSAEEFVGLLDVFLRRLGRTPTRAVPVAELTSLHPTVFEKCSALYAKQAYAEAVEKSFKVVRDRLRQLTGHETGSEAFGKGKLYVKGAAAANVDSDFNEAVKFLTMAIDRFRNEKSHTSDAHIEDPVRAYEYLRVSSLAMRLLDDAEVRRQLN